MIINQLRRNNSIFAAAFLKRHSSFGPSGMGAIYKLDYSGGGAPVVSTLVDLKSAPYNLNLGVFDESDAGRDFSTTSPLSLDADAFGKVGKVGLGGLAMSDDETTLYTINLFEKKLVKIPVGIPATTPVSVTEYSIPAPSCNLGTSRPFAVTFYKGLVYVGLVCSAENGGTVSDLAAYVYSFDPATNVFSLLPGFPFPLDYVKGATHYATGTMTASGTSWNPWSDDPNMPGRATGTVRYPQPILSDIDFAPGGDKMVLGFIDRTAHQWGYFNRPPDTGNPLVYVNSGGDILLAGKSGANWALESNAVAGGATGCGANNNQGPGGGEFFCNDFWGQDHLEIALGGNVINVARNSVKSSVYDPITYDTGGSSDFSLADGSVTFDYQVYNTGTDPATFGKAAGLGELDIIENAQSLEVGNRVWMDTDADGVQDADEMGIAGVTVKLFLGNTQVGQTSTSANGAFYFNNSNVTMNGAAGLVPNTANYTIRVDAGDFPSGKSLGLLPDVGGAGQPDVRDNDAVLNAGYAVITFSTGNPGENNHTYDIAFVCTNPSAITTSLVPPSCTGATGNNDGTASLVTVTSGTHYGVSTLNAATYDGPAFASATAIPGTLPTVIKTGVPNAGGTYIVRIFNSDAACYTDTTVTAATTTCTCAPVPCGTTTAVKN